jgi:hypothetical protein
MLELGGHVIDISRGSAEVFLTVIDIFIQGLTNNTVEREWMYAAAYQVVFAIADVSRDREGTRSLT